MALSTVVFHVGVMPVDEAVRVRRGAHAVAESPEGTSTIDSVAELPEALDHV